MNKHVAMHDQEKPLDAFPAMVTVTIISDVPPGTFDLSSTDVPVGKLDGDKLLTFNNSKNGGDGFDVTFTIEDKTGKGYKFFQDPLNPSLDDAMSAKVVGSSGHCPKRNQKWPGFSPTGISDDQLCLVVSNPNKYLQYFGFAFYFSLDGDSEPRLKYDPIGNNQDSISFD
jgi:hypothetical protein